MPIFRYTTKKIWRSPSTWIICAISLLLLAGPIIIFLAVLSSNRIEIKTKNDVLNGIFPIWQQIVFAAFFGFMALVFIVFKVTQIFRDEIDDGTLLILISKPVSRGRIWFEKWLSLQVSLLFYLFIISFLASFALLVPFNNINSVLMFKTIAPYVYKGLAIAFLFEFIISSIMLLITLVVSAKAIVGIMIGFAAALTVVGSVVDSALYPIDSSYAQIGGALKTYQTVNQHFNSEQKPAFENLLQIYQDGINPAKIDESTYDKNIKDLIDKVYKNYLKPSVYDATQEQQKMHDIAKNPAGYDQLTTQDKQTINWIVLVADAYRNNSQESYYYLMTGYRYPGEGSLGLNAHTTINNVLNLLTVEISKPYVNEIQKTILHKRLVRYFNIFYQLRYLWTGAMNQQSSVDDPYIVNFKVDPNNQDFYQVDVNVKSAKILNYPALLVVYIIIALLLTGASYYVFKRRDFV